MFKTIALLSLFLSVTSLHTCKAGEADYPTTEKARPAYIQTAIDERFTKLAAKEKSKWGYNGRKVYELCAVNEHKLLANLIENNASQKDFYVIDIGAGDYQWVNAVADFINEQVRQKVLPNDIAVHVVGVGAEKCQTVEGKKSGNCFLYKYGQIKIEEIDDELSKKESLRGKKFDLIVSSMTLRHLVDSVGTFSRIYYNLLQTNGYFFFSKFFFLYENEDPEYYLSSQTFTAEEHIISLLTTLEEPFLFDSLSINCNLVETGHVLKKLKRNPPYSLPWPYKGMESLDTYGPLNADSHALIRLKNNTADKKISVPEESVKNVDRAVLYGDKRLYDEFDALDLWQYDHKKVSWPYQPMPWAQE